MIPEWNSFINANCMDYLRQMPDKCVDLAITDPPYGEGVSKGGYMNKPRSNDVLAKNKDYHLSLWSMARPTEEYFRELQRVSKNQIIWGGNYFADLLPPSQCWIVWDKDNGENDFADCELAWTSFNRAVRQFTFKWQGMLQGDMKNKESRCHPSQKPVALYKWLIENFAAEGDTILDTHVGSASSLIACRETGHKYIGFEIDETYYKLAKERLDRATAQVNIFDLLQPKAEQITMFGESEDT